MMTPQETEQFAALRMHVAHLHNALKGAIEHAGSAPLDSLDACKAALEQSEPAVRDLLAEADRDAKLVACRAELQAKADALAQSTARLAKIEAAARKVVTSMNDPFNPEDIDLIDAVNELAEALK